MPHSFKGVPCMRKFAFALLSLILAAAVIAEELPPPPFVAPAEDGLSAPPPPVINIEDNAEAIPEPATVIVPTVEPTPAPTAASQAAGVPAAASHAPKSKKSKKKKGKAKAKGIAKGKAKAKLTPMPTMLASEGIKTNTALGSPAIAAPGAETPPAPVLNFADPVEAPPPPVISVPVESEAPAAPVVNAESSYEQIGGKGEPPTWFFTPEAISAPAAPEVVIAAETPTPQPAPEAPTIVVESEPMAPAAPPAPMIALELEPTASPVPVPAAAPVIVNIEKPRSGPDVLGDTVEAELKDAPKNNPEEAFSVALMLGRGKELESRGRYYEAWRTYRDIVKDYPKDKRGWSAMNSFYAMRLTARARKLEKQKRYYEAVNLYRDIVTRDASVASAWWGMGALFYKYKKKEQALYCFDKVIALKPKMTEFKNWVKTYREGK